MARNWLLKRHKKWNRHIFVILTQMIDVPKLCSRVNLLMKKKERNMS